MVATKDGRQIINANLITLKIVTFFLISGLAAVHILNAFLPEAWGLDFEEFRLISIVTPAISLIGPLIVGPLLDRIAAKNPNKFSPSLRIITALCLFFAAIFYLLLYTIPIVFREEARRPLVSFSCDSNGAVIFQERCTDEATCHHWRRSKKGSLILKNCSYTCQDPKQFESLYSPWVKGSPVPPSDYINSSDISDYDYITGATDRPKRDADNFYTEDSMEVTSDEFIERIRRQTNPEVYVEPPHLCTKKKGEDGNYVIDQCHVYTLDSKDVKVHAVLRSSINNDDNETHSPDWCRYALDGFQCNIPEAQAKWMRNYRGSNCTPAVECEVYDPYDSPDSVLADSVCIKITGDVDKTFWGISILRTFGEIFALAALTLLNTAIIVAVRDTSEGRGEVCRQYVWGAIGYIIILPTFFHIYVKAFSLDDRVSISLAAIILAAVCFSIAALILLFTVRMPLSPPEWWWHTKTGMLVYPMSAIRRYWPETTILTLIALAFGIFWSSVHTYLNYIYEDRNCSTLSGILFVLLLFFNADKFIEYAGHSNILIAGFAIFIIRFAALAGRIEWLTITMEILEPLVIGLIWVTIILYMRHIMPRKFTATGQAIAIIAFFCIGKSLGALIGLDMDEKNPYKENCMYHGLAIAACAIAIVYFIFYNLLLAPRCAAKPQPAPQLNLSPQTPANAAANNSAANGANGNYTPLRVYHNERGKKNQFRY